MPIFPAGRFHSSKPRPRDYHECVLLARAIRRLENACAAAKATFLASKGARQSWRIEAVVAVRPLGGRFEVRAAALSSSSSLSVSHSPSPRDSFNNRSFLPPPSRQPTAPTPTAAAGASAVGPGPPKLPTIKRDDENDEEKPDSWVRAESDGKIYSTAKKP